MEDGVWVFSASITVAHMGGKVLAGLVALKRLKTGGNEHPLMLIIHAQSMKTAEKGEERGFDGKKGERA
jgi:hypothetical protein